MTIALQCPAAVRIERYADVRAALLDARLVIHKPLDNPDGEDTRDPMSEPPVHSRSRRLAPLSRIMSDQLSRSAVARIAARAAALAAGFLEQGSRRGEMDLVADLAFPLPFTVMLDLLGLPHVEASEFRPLFAAISAGQDVVSTESQRTTARFAERAIMRWVARHLDASPSPLVAAIRSTTAPSGRERALQYWCAMLLHAGSTTTRGFIANCLARLVENPDEAETLRNNPGHLDSAIEELLRVEGPVRLLGRVAREDLIVGDRHVPRSALVHLHLHKANRDPAWFAEPDRVDFLRNPNPHLAFGLGATYCLGSHLARLEARTVLQVLLPQIARMQLAARPQWSSSHVLRECSRLAVRFH